MTGRKLAALLAIVASALGFVAFGLGYVRNGEFRTTTLVFAVIFAVFAVARRRDLVN
jgi:hypothetical protein